MILGLSHNAELLRTVAAHHGLMDVHVVMRSQVIPNTNPVIIHPHYSKLLYLQAGMITKNMEDID
jgi:hypothetical protein